MRAADAPALAPRAVDVAARLVPRMLREFAHGWSSLDPLLGANVDNWNYESDCVLAGLLLMAAAAPDAPVMGAACRAADERLDYFAQDPSQFGARLLRNQTLLYLSLGLPLGTRSGCSRWRTRCGD